MNVVGLDIATTTGACVLDGATIVHVEAFRPTGKEDPAIFHGFRQWLRALLVSHDIQHMGIEAPLVTDLKAPDRRPGAKPGAIHNPVTQKTYLRLYGLRAHAVEIAHALNIGCTEIHQATWRKAFTGNGRASKDDTLALARRLVPDLKSKDIAESLGVAWCLNGMLNTPKAADLFAEAAE